MKAKTLTGFFSQLSRTASRGRTGDHYGRASSFLAVMLLLAGWRLTRGTVSRCKAKANCSTA